MRAKVLDGAKRLKYQEEVRCIADRKGEAWLQSVMRPCNSRSVSSLPDRALIAIVAVWGDKNPEAA